MCEQIHISSDVDSEQDMKKATTTFFWFGNEEFCQKICNDLDNEQVVAFGTYNISMGVKCFVLVKKTTCYV